jgi:hypothetical protein
VCVIQEADSLRTNVYVIEKGGHGEEGRRGQWAPRLAFREETDEEEEEGREEGREGGGGFNLTLPGEIVWAKEGGRSFRSSCPILHHYLCPALPAGKEAEGGREDGRGGGSEGSRWGVAGWAGDGKVRRGQRASRVKIEGRVYTVNDLWPIEHEEEGGREGGGEGGREGGKGRGTMVEVREEFHRDVEATSMRGEGPLVLAPLRPIYSAPSSSPFPSSASSSSSSSSSSRSSSSLGRRYAPLLGTLPCDASWLACLAINPTTQHVVLGFSGGGLEILGSEHYAGVGGEEEERDEEGGEANGDGGLKQEEESIAVD